MAVASMHLGVWSWLLVKTISWTPNWMSEWEKRRFKQFWAWYGCWCQTGRSEYFTICSVTGIFIFLKRADGLQQQKTPPGGYNSSPLQKGKRGYNLQELTKIKQLKTGKMLPGLMSLDFCW